MTSTVQEEIRPRLTRVEDRGQLLKTLGPAAAQLVPGTAIALLGPPGVDLHRLATDIIRGIPEETLTVWIDLSEVSARLTRAHVQDDTYPAGGPWDKALDAMLQSGLEQGLQAEGMSRDALRSSQDGSQGTEDPGVGRLQAFAQLARRGRRWPVLVVQGMHRLPWPVSERLQWTLRKALDNADRPTLLRLVLTGASDFLSGEAIAEGAGFSTSPLYARTARYEVIPYTLEQLYELTPLPGGLPDRLLEILMTITGGSIGLIELFIAAFRADRGLGEALLEAVPPGATPPAWFWTWLSRAEGIGEPARDLIREGLGALLSSPKGRSWPILEALQSLLNQEVVEEAAADALLPLELAGLVGVDRAQSIYRYRFNSPLIPALLEAVLPDGRRLRDQLEVFRASFHWKDGDPPPSPRTTPEPSVRITGAGIRMHVEVPPAVPLTEPPKPTTPPAPKRVPLELPQAVTRLVNDRSAGSALRLIELLREIAAATELARRERNPAILTLAQLDIQWIPAGGATLAGLTPAPPSIPGTEGEASSPAAPVLPPGRWEVHLELNRDDSARQLEAAALFLPPERLSTWLHAQTSSQQFIPTTADDAYAIGILGGLLLAREPDARLIVERIEQRLTGALDIGVGQLMRLIRRCLDPQPRRRPSLDDIVNALDEVMRDPFGLGRRILRYVTLSLMISTVVLGLVDWGLDTRVDNPNWFYVGLKVVGAAAWAAFYVLAWVVFGRTDRAQIHQQLWAFIRQRMNRIRWMIVPFFVSLGFTLTFAFRLVWNWEVALTLPVGETLEEIKWREAGSTDCEDWHTWHKFSPPVNGAAVRMLLKDQEYLFLLDQEIPGKLMQRRLLYWPAEEVRKQRGRHWGDTFYLQSLQVPSSDTACIPIGLVRSQEALPAEGDK